MKVANHLESMKTTLKDMFLLNFLLNRVTESAFLISTGSLFLSSGAAMENALSPKGAILDLGINW